MIGQTTPTPPGDEAPAVTLREPDPADPATVEYGGREGPEPTRYGDWEKHGRCIDF